MKTKSRNLLISVLIVFAMLFTVFAISPLTASARAYPDPTKIPAETIYVGGVALNAGQYVKNGETTATTGEPAEDASGFAWYTEDGTLVLVDYTYQGKGYEYSSGNYALIYSTGMLYVTGGGVNTLKQTQSYNMGIYSVGSLTIAPMGTVNVKDYEGKIVVLNFWGTWCGPCVGELPEFDELATEYDGSVVFIAVHSVQQSDEAPEFIDSNYPDSKIKFAYDTPINSAIGAYFNVFGAKGYPTTLVLDKNGVITYKHTGQISGDILESEITKAIG